MHIHLKVTWILKSHINQSTKRLPKLVQDVEGLVLCDGEDEKKALARPEVAVANGGVVFLAGCVQNVDLHFFAVQLHLLPLKD